MPRCQLRMQTSASVICCMPLCNLTLSNFWMETSTISVANSHFPYSAWNYDQTGNFTRRAEQLEHNNLWWSNLRMHDTNKHHWVGPGACHKHLAAMANFPIWPSQTHQNVLTLASHSKQSRFMHERNPGQQWKLATTINKGRSSKSTCNKNCVPEIAISTII